jgi:ABC-2 type transport system ATP-binding protein
MSMLATLLVPDDGRASVLGFDVVHEANEVRRRVTLTGQYASVDEQLTGRENLILLGRLYGYRHGEAKARADELLEAFNLTDAGARTVETYSGGMRRKLDIAGSIVVTPDLMFLDEPTTGLDPRSRNGVWEVVRALVRQGTTVLLTTQYLDEADQLADRIAVIDRGTIIAEGTSGELKASVGAGALHVRLRDPDQRPEGQQLLARTLGVQVHFDSDPVSLNASVEDPERVATALTELARARIDVAEFALGQPSLDEVFFALTGRPAEDADERDAETTNEEEDAA